MSTCPRTLGASFVCPHLPAPTPATGRYSIQLSAIYSQTAAKFVLVVIDQNASGKKLGWVGVWGSVNYEPFRCIFKQCRGWAVVCNFAYTSTLAIILWWHRTCWVVLEDFMLMLCEISIISRICQAASIMLSWHEFVQTTIVPAIEAHWQVWWTDRNCWAKSKMQFYAQCQGLNLVAFSRLCRTLILPHTSNTSTTEQLGTDWTWSHGRMAASSKLKYALRLAMTRFKSVSSMDRFVRVPGGRRSPHDQNQAWDVKGECTDFEIYLCYASLWADLTPNRLWCIPIQSRLAAQILEPGHQNCQICVTTG